MNARPDLSCIVCGQEAVSHHLAGVVNVPSLTVPACDRHHLLLDAALRQAGVPLAHDRTPTETEIVYALIAGITSVYSLTTAEAGEHGCAQALVVDRLAAQLRRLLLALLPTGERRLGPEPVKRASQARGGRHPKGRPLVAPAAQFAQLFALLSQAAREGLERTPDQRPYLQTLAAASDSAAEAARSLETIERHWGDRLRRMSERDAAAMAELVEATVELDLPEPTDAQLGRLTDALSQLALIERAFLALLPALAAARDDRQALAVLDQYLGELGS